VYHGVGVTCVRGNRLSPQDNLKSRSRIVLVNYKEYTRPLDGDTYIQTQEMFLSGVLINYVYPVLNDDICCVYTGQIS